MSVSDCSAAQSSVQLFITLSQKKLILIQFLAILSGRLLEVVAQIISFEIIMSTVGDELVHLSDVLALQGIIMLFQLRLPLAFYDYGQQRFSQYQLARHKEKEKLDMQALICIAAILGVGSLIFGYPLAKQIIQKAQLSKSIEIQVNLILFLSPVLYLMSYGQQNLFQVESRFLMVITVRVVGSLMFLFMQLNIIIRQPAFKTTYFVQVIQIVVYVIVTIWLIKWGSGKSVLNIKNKTVIRWNKELLRFRKEDAKDIAILILKYFGVAITSLAQHLNEPAILLIAQVTSQEFTSNQANRKHFVQCQLYIFFVIGQIMQAPAFATQQCNVFNIFMYKKKNMHSKIMTMHMLLLAYSFVTATILYLVLKFSPISRYFCAGSKELITYLDNEANERDFAMTLLGAYLIALGMVLQEQLLVYLLSVKMYLPIFFYGLAKVIVSVVSVFQNYKYQFEQLNMIKSYILSELIGIVHCLAMYVVVWCTLAKRQKQQDAKSAQQQ